MVRDGPNTLPQAPCVSAVTEVSCNLPGVLLFHFPDATDRSAWIALSEGNVAGPQQPVDLS